MKNTDDTLNFPVQSRDWDEPMTEAELIQNFRLSAARVLNAKAEGRYELTLKDIKGIVKVNNILLRLGYPPIINDISELQ
jgi:hypothetical protein